MAVKKKEGNLNELAQIDFQDVPEVRNVTCKKISIASRSPSRKEGDLRICVRLLIRAERNTEWT